MPTYSFGSGVLLGTRTDVANATPINFGLAQQVSIDISFTTKELYGQFQFPVAIARGTGKITGKANVASISPLAFGDLSMGQTPQVGQTALSYGEAGAVPSTGTPQVTAANAANYVGDHGVLAAGTGEPLIKVASAPTAGQYAVAAGVYSFAAADAGLAVLISYTYKVTASGRSVRQVNQLLGQTPTFSAKFYTTFQGKTVGMYFPRCTSSKFSFGTKLEDFVIPEFDFSCFADDSGLIANYDFG